MRGKLENRRRRRADKDELLDFAMGLISDSSNAMETILVDIEEQPCRSEDCYEESRKKDLTQ